MTKPKEYYQELLDGIRSQREEHIRILQGQRDFADHLLSCERPDKTWKSRRRKGTESAKRTERVCRDSANVELINIANVKLTTFMMNENRRCRIIFTEVNDHADRLDKGDKLHQNVREHQTELLRACQDIQDKPEHGKEVLLCEGGSDGS